jgi:hypothetical protein
MSEEIRKAVRQSVAHSGEFGQAQSGSFRTPRGAVGGREATDVCVSRRLPNSPPFVSS